MVCENRVKAAESLGALPALLTYTGIHWMEHVVCLSDFFVFFVFSLNGTSEQKGL